MVWSTVRDRVGMDRMGPDEDVADVKEGGLEVGVDLLSVEDEALALPELAVADALVSVLDCLLSPDLEADCEGWLAELVALAELELLSFWAMAAAEKKPRMTSVVRRSVCFRDMRERAMARAYLRYDWDDDVMMASSVVEMDEGNNDSLGVGVRTGADAVLR